MKWNFPRIKKRQAEIESKFPGTKLSAFKMCSMYLTCMTLSKFYTVHTENIVHIQYSQSVWTLFRLYWLLTEGRFITHCPDWWREVMTWTIGVTDIMAWIDGWLDLANEISSWEISNLGLLRWAEKASRHLLASRVFCCSANLFLSLRFRCLLLVRVFDLSSNLPTWFHF